MSQSVTLGTRLKEIRIAHGYTQEKMAKLMNVSRVAYGYYEKGERDPRHDQIADVCRELGESADYLLGLSDTRNPYYAKVAEATGLSETAISYLDQPFGNKRLLISLLLEDATLAYPFEDERCNTPPVKSWTDAHEAWLDFEEWKKIEGLKKSIKNIKHDITAENAEGFTEEELLDLQETIREQLTEELEMYGKTEFTLEEHLRFRALEAFRSREDGKSDLLTKIQNYVLSDSRVDMSAKTHGGITLTMSDQKSQELYEFMLIMNVIEALKKFKKYYYEATHK